MRITKNRIIVWDNQETRVIRYFRKHYQRIVTISELKINLNLETGRIRQIIGNLQRFNKILQKNGGWIWALDDKDNLILRTMYKIDKRNGRRTPVTPNAVFSEIEKNLQTGQAQISQMTVAKRMKRLWQLYKIRVHSKGPVRVIRRRGKTIKSPSYIKYVLNIG